MNGNGEVTCFVVGDRWPVMWESIAGSSKMADGGHVIWGGKPLTMVLGKKGLRAQINEDTGHDNELVLMVWLSTHHKASSSWMKSTKPFFLIVFFSSSQWQLLNLF